MILTIAVLAIVGLWIWLNPAAPSAVAEQALRTDERVFVTDNGWLTFEPADGTPEIGLVFYPGGLVPAEAYAPLARAVADEGFLVAVPHMPLNLAVFAPSAADEILAEHSEIDIWAVGGHSLGGAMAASYVFESSRVNSLVMVAAYPSQSVDLSTLDVEVLVIYATRDGLFTAEEVVASLESYPADADVVVIEGGNHAQFGSYGSQRGDRAASIPSSDQLSQTARAMVTFLADLQDG